MNIRLIHLQSFTQVVLTCVSRFVQLLALLGNNVDEMPHVVATFQQYRYQVSLYLNISVSYTNKHVFNDMGKLNDGIQIEHAGRTLDGVSGTEKSSYGVGIVMAVFQLQEYAFHFLQQGISLQQCRFE